MKTIFTFLLMIIAFTSAAQKGDINMLLKQEKRFIGRNADNEVVLEALVQYAGNEDSVALSSVALNLEGTTRIADIEKIKVYTTRLDDDFDFRFLNGATLIGETEPQSSDFSCELNGYLLKGINYLWLTVETAADAVEGNFIDMSCLSISTETETAEPNNSAPSGNREIILARTTLLCPGDYNSTNYRIPAIITARDGSLVAVTDKRKYNNGDLPEDIDILCNRSLDGGITWTEPHTIAYGTGYNNGFGDCALSLTNDENGIMAVFVGGPGFWQSTPDNPLRCYMSRSNDNGISWTEPEDITHFIYGSECPDEERQNWAGAFFGSGNGLLTSTGRIMFVVAARDQSVGAVCNFAVYSDDNGQTWNVSERASIGGDEAKVTELVDGRILMSIRHNGNRWYNVSSDGGITWQETTSEWTEIVAPACNGDLIRYTSVNQNDDKNRLLHSVPFGSSRKDVTVYVSYDEGETWTVSKCIVPYNSAYSSLCVLPDKTIGLYVEESYQGEGDYRTVFYNFSLDWLTNGEDTYVSVGEIIDNQCDISIDIYPNPTSSYINVSADGMKEIVIYNVKGQKIISLNDISESVKIDVSDYTSGLYIIEARDNDNNVKKNSFIVQ